MQEDLSNIIESLLFVSEEPLTVEKLKHIFETVGAKEIRSALQSLAEQYEVRGGGFKLAEVAGGWQLRSRAQYNPWIKRMLQPSPQRLTKASLETLAIVAYNQPIIRADIEHIRGVDSGGVLRQLLERKLVRVLGRKEIPGRPLIYATTKLFLELFELKDLKDLPSPKEIEEMSAAAEPEPDLPSSNLVEISAVETAQQTVQDLLDQDSPRIDVDKNLPALAYWTFPKYATTNLVKTKSRAPKYPWQIHATPSRLPDQKKNIPTDRPHIPTHVTNTIPGQNRTSL
jgi:segregation and condensation protein B